MERKSFKKFIIFPIVMLLVFSFIGSVFFFTTKQEQKDTPLDNTFKISQLIEKYSPGKKVVKDIDNEYLTEEDDKKISISDFCTLTGTTLSEDEDFITLNYNDFSININKANNYLVTTDGNIVLLEENNNSLYPINLLAENLGFDMVFKSDKLSLSRPYQTKRIIVRANGEFDPVGAIEVIPTYNNLYLLQFTTELEAMLAINKLNTQEFVEYAEPNVIIGLEDEIPEDVYNEALASGTFLSWGGEKIGADDYKAYLQSAIGENSLDKITVAVLDTGIDTDHSMFSGRISQYSHNFVNTKTPNSPEDDHGHGTHVSGIICDLTYSNVQILALKVLDGEGYGETINITNAIYYARDLKNSTLTNLVALNMSLGGGYHVGSTGHTSYTNAVNAAYTAGLLSIVAAGNGDDDGNAIDVKYSCPANINTSITVGAVGVDYYGDYYIGHFSNYGDYVDISAPGISVVSASYTGTTTTKTGTSMAAPHISAVVALLLSDKTVTYNNLKEIEDALKFYTVDVGDPGWDKYFGVGVPDLTYAYCDKLEPVVFSKTDSKCSEPFELTLSHTNADANVQILYTLDGSTPTVQNSTVYTGPITISTSTTVKAIACILYNGSITKCSKITQMTYQFDFVVDENGYLIGYNGTDSEVVVPETVNGITVVAIDEYCFMENTTITSVTLPETLVHIGRASFGYCENLTKVIAPGVEYVADYAFYNCTNFKYLNDVYFPKLEYISRYAFYNCTSITSVSLPTVLVVDESAFANCTSLLTVTLNAALTIDYGVFQNCYLLASATLPNCQIIASTAFKNCRLSSISFPNVVLVGSAAFAGNTSLAAASLPNAIYVGSSCFSSAPLDTISAINLQIVGRHAFFGCSELTTINFPNVTRVEHAAFGDTSLTTINLDSAKVIEGLAFQNVPASSISLPSVVKIKAHAFERLATLNILTLSHCIEEIEPLAINSCTNCVIKGYPNTVAQTYAVENGYTFSPITTSKTSLEYNVVDNREIHITGFKSTLSQGAIIPDYIDSLPVTAIKTGAFKDCTKIEKIQSNTIISIEESAFENCTNLETIILESATSIGNSAFKGCTNLNSVSINKVENIGDSAFESCTNLLGFTFNNPAVTIGANAFGFDGSTKNTSFIIYCYKESTAEAYATNHGFTYYYIANELNGFYYSFYTASSGEDEIYIASVSKTINGEITLPSEYEGYTISAIGDEAFMNCSFITKVNLPSSYKIIGINAFKSCSLLESINLENIIEVGDGAFYSCYNLKQADLASAIYLGQEAFRTCTSLETVNIPNIESIGYETFYSCEELHTVYGDNIKNIGEWAFWQTKKLQNINLKNTEEILDGFCVAFDSIYLPSIKVIGDHAFAGNSQLKKLVINNTITSIGEDAISTIGTNTVVYGYVGTAAETYTTANDIPFVPIEDISIEQNLTYLYEFDNSTADPTIRFLTTGFDATYVWYTNTEQTKLDAIIAKESSENFYLVDNNSVGVFYIYCTATDWKGESVTSILACVEVTYSVYYTVTVTAHGNGSISPDGNNGVVSIKENQEAVFYFFPHTGYEISHVVIDGINIGKATSQKFPKMTKNHTIDVYFTIIKLKITTTVNGGGTISTENGDVNGEEIVDYGQETTFFFTPSEGYKLVSVTVDGAQVQLRNSSYTFLSPTRSYAIVANFEKIKFDITIISNGATVSPTNVATVEYGSDLQISVASTVEYQVTQVLKDGEILLGNVSMLTSFAFPLENIKAACTIEVVTIPHPYYITTTTDTNGSVQNNNICVTYNETAIVELIPNAGFKVSKLVVDGVEVDPTNTLEFANVASDHQISAEFAHIIYNISFDLGGFGEIEEVESDTAIYGEDRLYTIKTNPLYEVDEVFVNGKKIEVIDGNKISLKGISDDSDIKVTFKKNLSIPIALAVVAAVALIFGVSILLFVRRRIRLGYRKRANLTSMLHTSKKTDVKTIKIKDEFLLDDKKSRRKTNKKS